MTLQSIHETGGLLREADAARLLGVSTRTLQFWRANGTGPVYRKFGPGRAAVRYAADDLEDFIERAARGGRGQ